MKIAIVAERVLPERGGAETSTAQFLEHLRSGGVEVELYTSSTAPSGDGLTVHTIPTDHLLRSRRSLAFSRGADDRLAGRPYDVVHAITPCMRADIYQPRGGTVPETVARNLAMRLTPVTRCLKRLANRLNMKQRGMLRLERDLLRRSPPPTVVAISDYVVRQFEEHYGVDRRRIRRIYNAVDHDPPSAQTRCEQRASMRSLYGIADDEQLALMIAHNFKLKGLAPWLRALQRISTDPGRRVKCLIVGKGQALAYRGLVDSLGLTERVTFVGPTQEVQAFYHAADVFVHPTYYDPCSRVVLEAMLTGLPCVTTRFNGAAEVIDDGVTGRVIDSPDDIAALAGAVKEVLDGDHRAALQQAHDQLAGRLSMKRHAEEMIELYRSLIG